MSIGKITFLGAAQTVTGSKFLLEILDIKILIDCGLFQGLKPLRLLNWETLPVDVKSIQYTLLTHAHLDHCGYLPCIVKHGYNNPIYGTPATLEVAKIILADSAKIQQEDADKANNLMYSKHQPALPLYTQQDVENTIRLFTPVSFNVWHTLEKEIRFRFRPAGHIPGAAFIELLAAQTRFVFSGDIGNWNDPLMNDPEKPESADVLLIESTYGNRNHQTIDENKIASTINSTLKKGGTVIIPGFAVERAQLLMYYLTQLRVKELIPHVPVYLDSPMANQVLRVIGDYLSDMKIDNDVFTRMISNINIIEDYDETLKLCTDTSPKIIIAASGMATGGRVLTYFDYFISNSKNLVLLAGYQAPGTRGRLLLDGADHLKFYGKLHKVRAKVTCIEGLSAHADQTGLNNWLSSISNKPEYVFLVHGDQEASIALQKKIKKILKWDNYIPQLNESVTINLK